MSRNKCPECGAGMKPLFQSFYCPNEENHGITEDFVEWTVEYVTPAIYPFDDEDTVS